VFLGMSKDVYKMWYSRRVVGCGRHERSGGPRPLFGKSSHVIHATRLPANFTPLHLRHIANAGGLLDHGAESNSSST
jgi:hypothetical protein